MKYFIIAGEASGDLHASNLIKSLKIKDAKASFQFLGGDLMQKASGQKPIIHFNQMAFMGFIDVISNLKKIWKNLKKTKKAIRSFNPDVVILVDYPGFNLKIAKFAHKKAYKTVYYISPKLWAWKEGRVKQIKKYVDKLLLILPFEVAFYKKHQVKATYVGNPVVDAVQQHKAMPRNEFYHKFNLPHKPIIALLPGSRIQELKMMLPTMLQIVENFPDYQFVISGAPSFTVADYQEFIQDRNIPILFNHTYDLLLNAHSAIVTSGTAALETALFKVPQVVVYKTQQWQYNIGKHFIKINYFSLPNLILNQEAIKELLQNTFTAEILTKELKAINQGNQRSVVLHNYQELSAVLGSENASEKAADSIINFLSK